MKWIVVSLPEGRFCVCFTAPDGTVVKDWTYDDEKTAAEEAFFLNGPYGRNPDIMWEEIVAKRERGK